MIESFGRRKYYTNQNLEGGANEEENTDKKSEGGANEHTI